VTPDDLNIIRRLHAWKDNLNRAIGDLQRGLADISARADDTATRQAATEAALGEAVAALVAADARWAEHLRAIDAEWANRLSAAESAWNARFDLMSQEITALRAEGAAIRADLRSLQERQDTELAAVRSALDGGIADLNEALAAAERRHGELAAEATDLFRARVRSAGPAGAAVAAARDLYLQARGGQAVIVASSGEQSSPVLCSGNVAEIVGKIVNGEIGDLFVVVDPPADGRPALLPANEIIPLFRALRQLAAALFLAAQPARKAKDEAEFYDRALERLKENPFLVDALAAHHDRAFGTGPVPFDAPGAPPLSVAAEPKRRSVLFLHNNYYHFNQMAEGLRKRGWDAMTVSVESPNSPNRQYYHGEDLNLNDPDPLVMREKVRQFFATVPERFGAVHFYGQGLAGLFQENFESSQRPVRIPWDFFELRRHRMIIGFMPSGCCDGVPQSDIRRISGGLCRFCAWEHEPSVCHDARNWAWAQRLEALCDWIGIEGDWVVGPRTGSRYVRGPVVTALNPDTWRPDLKIPKAMKLERAPGEILVYHAVGNDEARRREGKDIKGTGAVFEAIEMLRGEGLPVRLVFFSNVLSTQIKNYQVQADIVIDQLRYGRYGANARECLMLGRPVIGAIDPRQEDTEETLRLFDECPIIRANCDTAAGVLRDLVQDASARERVGRASRAFAIRWHGVEACAERFEKVIDRVREGLPPDSPDLYPAPQSQDDSGAAEAAAMAEETRSRRVNAKLPSHRASQDRR
jgi:hypothetical protein